MCINELILPFLLLCSVFVYQGCTNANIDPHPLHQASNNGKVSELCYGLVDFKEFYVKPDR